MRNNLIIEYLKDNKYKLDFTKSTNLKITDSNNELIITGSREDLIELADYIVGVALSDNNDHLHLDDLTIISKESKIKNLIIEKNG